MIPLIVPGARLWAFAAAVLVGTNARARPADPTPAVRGTVTDSSGTPLANVTLTIAALRRTTTSAPDGRFAFHGLPAGRHHLDAALIGYARSEVAVEVAASGPDVTVTIVMQSTPLRLSNVVVTATPSGGDPLGITQSTADLGGKELARTLSTSLAQTLASEPGMAVRYNGPAASMPVIRGLTGERILVLQDGERSGDLSAAAPDHGTTIDPLAADRIEVVRGPASLLYGSSALGGVVNVISNDIPTTIPSHVAGFLAGQSESAAPGGALSGAVTVPLGSALALSASGGFRNTGSVRMGGGADLFNSDSRNNRQQVGLGVVGDRGMIGASVGRYDFRYGLPAEPDDPDAGGKIDGLRTDARVQGQVNGRGVVPLVTLTATAQSYHHQEIEHTGDVGTSFNLTTRTVNATAKTAIRGTDGAFGVSGLFKRYDATGEEALTPPANTRSLGAFVFQDLALGARGSRRAPHLQMGARFDAYDIDTRADDPKFGAPRKRDFNAFSGSVGLTVPLSPIASVALSAARAFRAPSVEELFSNAFHAAAGTFDVGNPDLEAETNSGVDAVFRVQGRTLDGQFAVYYNAIDNYVAPFILGDTTTSDGSTIPLNHFGQENATLKGVEARIEGEVAPHIVIGGMTDFTRGTFRDGSNVPFLPAARVGGNVRWEMGRWSVGTDVRHGFAQQKVSGGSVDIPTGSYTLVSLSAALSLIRGGILNAITIRADNVFDEQYQDATSRIKNFAFNPGRSFSILYRVAF